MILVIGLGNPGQEYENTRHNVGRDFVLAFAKKHDFDKLATNEKLKSLVTEGKIGKERFVLIAPETFMNKSGDAARKAQLIYKMRPEKIFVVHDDADIELARTKLSFNRDSAGHKGIESVMRALGTKKFWRFRIGIGAQRPTNLSQRGERRTKKLKHIPAENLVLKKFSAPEEAIVKKVRSKTLGAVADLSQDPPEKIMNHYNK